jgi:hypothetical protein
MTLCAAAITGDYIVTISDTMVSGSTISADGCTLKMEPFARDWLAMISGDDITQALPIIQRASKYMHHRANTVATARVAFKKAYQQHLVEMKTDAVLSGYGLNMDTFQKSGKRRFTDKIFASLCENMDAVKVGCEFLVFGFDGAGRAHIFTVSDPGIDRTFDKPGFCCIGSGMYAADAMLYYFQQATDKSLSETVFALCASKFMAERSGIGRDTYLYVMQFGSIFSQHRPGLIDDVRKAWDGYGAPSVPRGVIELINEGSITQWPSIRKP